MKTDKERTFTTAEIAEEYGITEEELTEIVARAGFLDENGRPTPLALSLGLCHYEYESEEEQEQHRKPKEQHEKKHGKKCLKIKLK